MRDRLTKLLGARRNSRTGDARLIRLSEFALVIAIGIVLVSIFWSAFAPVIHPPTTPRASAAPAAQEIKGPIDPFRMAAADLPVAEGSLGTGPDLAETTLNLVLHGTWIDEKGGAAIIKTPDDKQGRYSVGDTVTAGVTLERVFRDQVVINRAGVRESLRLINREALSRNEPASAGAAAGKFEATVDGLAAIGNLIVATPELDDIGNLQLVLQPSDDEDGFNRLGLRAGDALVAIDNRPIAGDIAKGLETIDSLGGKQSVTISIERDGVVMPIVVPLNRGDAEEE